MPPEASPHHRRGVHTCVRVHLHARVLRHQGPVLASSPQSLGLRVAWALPTGCLSMRVALVCCQGSVVGGADGLGSRVSYKDTRFSCLPPVGRGCGECRRGSLPTLHCSLSVPLLTCLPLFLLLSPEAPDSGALPR